MASLQDSDPRQVAVYRLLERLAVGGMGIIYLGESPSGRQVAVKVIRSELASDPEFRERFRREVKAVQLVGGFHTAAVVDAGLDDDPPWMVTEFVPGPSLEAKVRRDGPLDPAAVHQLATALAEGLHAIHSRGLVHRDLKPLNIIMAPSGPRIIDFGIAKAAGTTSDPRLTATGMVVGTPAFLSPEQLDDDDVGPASDIFSLGSVLAFAASGRMPFDGHTFKATSYAIVNKLPDLRAVAGPILDVITACLAKDPRGRPTAADLLTYLYRTRQPRSPGPPAPEDQRDQPARPASAPPPAAKPAYVPSPAAKPTSAPPSATKPTSVLPPAAKSASVPAALRRRGLVRRAAVPGVTAADGTVRSGTMRSDPVRMSTAPQARRSQPARPQLQVRPVRHGWRLVTAAADGRWLASANGDGIITVWLAGSGLPVRSWSAGTRVHAMTAAPGDLLAVATGDGRVTAWDVTTGTSRAYLPPTVPGLTGQGTRVRCLAADPSGSWLAASVEGRLLLWDVADPGEPLLAAGLPCPAEVTALAFDDTGWRLATGDDDGKVHVWDLAELAVAEPVSAAAGAATFDAAAMETVRVNPPGTLPGASRPRSGRMLALAWDAGRDRWLSVGTTNPPGWLDGAATDRTATDRAGADRAGWDGTGPDDTGPDDTGPDDTGPEATGIAGVQLRAAALSTCGGFVAVIDNVSGLVHLASLDDPAHPRVLDGAGLSITGVAFTGSGALALGGSDGSLRLWHPSRRAMEVITAAGRPVTAVAASPDGTRLVVSDKRAALRSLRAVNGSLKPGWTVESAEPAESVAFRAGGTGLATAGDAVRTWNAADGRLAGTLPGRTAGRARAVAADRDGKRVAAAWAESVVTVWEGKRLLWELAGHQGAVLAVAFGPRPGLLVSAGDDETIRTWDLALGRAVACHSGLGYRATVLAAGPSGTTLAAGCADGTVRLYEGGTGGSLPDWAGAPVLAGHAHGITAMSFDVSGRFLATASRDGTARIWDLATRSTTTVLLPGAAAAVSGGRDWRSLGAADGLAWQADGLTRVPLPPLEEDP
jgi:serine/threonine protein kinase/WD40 repeat protein